MIQLRWKIAQKNHCTQKEPPNPLYHCYTGNSSQRPWMSLWLVAILAILYVATSSGVEKYIGCNPRHIVRKVHKQDTYL